jgi:transcriptional regulator with XRE-family HTH domain
MMDAAQCKMARAALSWSAADLARIAQVGVATVNRFEAGASVPIPATLAAMQRALEEAGAIFIDNGEGPGVKVRDRRKWGQVWKKGSGKPLLTIRDGKVYRASDDREVGIVANGNVLDLKGQFVCQLSLLESPAPAGDLPAALKALIE